MASSCCLKCGQTQLGCSGLKGGKKIHGVKRERDRTDQTVIKPNRYLKPFLSQKVKRKMGQYVCINSSCVILHLGKRLSML